MCNKITNIRVNYIFLIKDLFIINIIFPCIYKHIIIFKKSMKILKVDQKYINKFIYKIIFEYIYIYIYDKNKFNILFHSGSFKQIFTKLGMEHKFV